MQYQKQQRSCFKIELCAIKNRVFQSSNRNYHKVVEKTKKIEVFI